MQSMVREDVWNKTRTRNELYPAERVKYNPVAEMRKAKNEALSAVEELLEMLPADDVKCGMVKVLGEWILKEIDILPDDLLVQPDAD